MSVRDKLCGLPEECFSGEGLVIREIRDDDDLWYATVECALASGQEDFVNPAGFAIGRAYLHPEANVPCVICLESGERIGFMIFRDWLGAGTAYSWSYYLDKDWQGRGYGKSAARLAVRILKAADQAMPIKLSTEQANEKAQRLYGSIGFRKLDEMDGDDLVFGL